MEANARDARRRRLVERGTDRLAFITGQTRALAAPPTSPAAQSPSTSFSEKDSTDLQLPQFNKKSNEATTVENTSLMEAIIASKIAQEPPKDESDDKPLKSGMSSEAVITNVEKVVRNVEMSPANRSGLSVEDSAARRSGLGVEASPAKTSGLGVEASTHTPMYREWEVHTAPQLNPFRNLPTFTASEISQSISWSENIRLFCAVAIGLLVVLSYYGFSLGGKIVSGVINFRPLFLVLLTDATIVLGRVMLNKENEGDSKGSTREIDSGSTDSLGQALDIALAAQKALTAAFMDCSICAVIMICAFVYNGSL